MTRVKVLRFLGSSHGIYFTYSASPLKIGEEKMLLQHCYSLDLILTILQRLRMHHIKILALTVVVDCIRNEEDRVFANEGSLNIS